MKSYKDYINHDRYVYPYKKSYESLSDTNLSEYEYPYERILIIVESKDDLLKLMEMFKNIFDININIDDNFADRIKTHLVLYVDDFYDIVEKKRNNIEFYELFSVYTTDEITIEQLIERINKRIDFGDSEKTFYNEKDIVYPYYYKKIKNLLAGKASFQSIYKKEIEKSYESLLSKLEGPSEEEVMKNIENKWLDEQLAIFINNGYMKGILKIKKMFDDDIYGDGVDGFKSFKQLLEQTNLHISDVIDFPDVLEFIDKYGILKFYYMESMIKECILKSKKDSLNYLLKKYNNDAKKLFSTRENKIYLSNPMLRIDFGIVEVLLNNGIFDSNPYFYFNQAIKYGGEEMGELFIKKYNFKESLLNNIVYKRK